MNAEELLQTTLEFHEANQNSVALRAMLFILEDMQENIAQRIELVKAEIKKTKTCKYTLSELI